MVKRMRSYETPDVFFWSQDILMDTLAEVMNVRSTESYINAHKQFGTPLGIEIRDILSLLKNKSVEEQHRLKVYLCNMPNRLRRKALKKIMVEEGIPRFKETTEYQELIKYVNLGLQFTEQKVKIGLQAKLDKYDELVSQNEYEPLSDEEIAAGILPETKATMYAARNNLEGVIEKRDNKYFFDLIRPMMLKDLTTIQINELKKLRYGSVQYKFLLEKYMHKYIFEHEKKLCIKIPGLFEYLNRYIFLSETHSQLVQEFFPTMLDYPNSCVVDKVLTGEYAADDYFLMSQVPTEEILRKRVRYFTNTLGFVGIERRKMLPEFVLTQIGFIAVIQHKC
jgi:hypothetical protein